MFAQCLYNSTSALNNAAASRYAAQGSVDWGNYMDLLHGGKKSLMEYERNGKAQRPHTHRNAKRHISQMSLLLCQKILVVQCFVWYLGLQMW